MKILQTELRKYQKLTTNLQLFFTKHAIENNLLSFRTFSQFMKTSLIGLINACLEYGILMQIKRTFSKNQLTEIDDFINRLLLSDSNTNQSWIQSYANNSQLQRYFVNLHKYITGRNLHHLKAYETLIDGLYILLKGQIKFMSEQSSLEKSKMKKMKSSKSSLCSGGAIINRNWSVFECTYKNCTATAESFLLRITQQQATLAKFFQMQAIRNELYLNRYLSQDHHKFYEISSTQKPFYVDLKIHSHFSFKSFNFRELLSLPSPAIILSGSAKLKVPHFYTRQFDKYGALLPNLKYEVSSSQITLMIIENNQTLSYDFQLRFDKSPKVQQYSYINSVYRTEICTPNHSENLSVHKQRKSKEKQKSKLFKESQQYSIISKFLCEKSLNFAKKHNIIHNTKQKKENRCKSPLILFDIVNEKSKISTPKFQTIHSITPNQPNKKYLSAHKVSSQSECTQTNLLKKVKIQSRDYHKYINMNSKTSLKQLKQKETKLKRIFNLTLDRIQSQKWNENTIEYSSPKLI